MYAFGINIYNITFLQSLQDSFNTFLVFLRHLVLKHVGYAQIKLYYNMTTNGFNLVI